MYLTFPLRLARTAVTRFTETMMKQKFTGNYYGTFHEVRDVRKKECLRFKGKYLDNEEDIQEIKITKLKRSQTFSTITWSASFSGKSEGTTANAMNNVFRGTASQNA